MPVKFAEPKRRHTKRFERYVIELLQFMTPTDVARHLGISWDLANDIQKRRLGKRFARPKLRRLKQIAIDEIHLGTRHRYITLVLDLDSGAVVFVGDGKGGWRCPTEKCGALCCQAIPLIGPLSEAPCEFLNQETLCCLVG